MGLDTVYFLSDRIFSILDDNKDDRVVDWRLWKIRFEEFVFYFDKITNGDQGEKAEISYKLID
jgi:1-phosphatidylinositol-4-phosphate 5-kinase